MIAEKVRLGYMGKITKVMRLPRLLREISDAPRYLYAEGNTNLLYKENSLYICIVGARKHSFYGKEVTEFIITCLSDLNVVVVSGAAYGIDGLVHTLCIKNNIPTIAVPGSGISDEAFYPRLHLDLKHEILSAGGLIINEFDPTTQASVWTFPVRNRIMAGMCHVTIVIEAEKRSGTLITANLAADYNRDVVVVPGSIFSPTSTGTLDLASKGAILLTSKDSLINILRDLAKKEGIDILNRQQLTII